VLRLSGILEDVIVDSGLGVALPAPIDVFFSHHTILQPDMVILVGERADMYLQGKIDAPPSLVIEILSPSTGKVDRQRKRNLYARYGVSEYWIVDPDAHMIEILSQPVSGLFRNERTAHELAVSDTIPTLSVDLSELFAPPRRFQR
jgi:Uma2 family endonuclease